jgi:hypothetical protein
MVDNSVWVDEPTKALRFVHYHTAIAMWDSASNTLPTLDRWYHVGVTYDKGNINNDPIFYIDGDIVPTKELQTPADTAADDNAQSLRIGNYSDIRTFDGLIDDLKIYNYILTPEEMKLDYNQGKSAVMGALSSTSTNGVITPDWSKAREYCVPGDSSVCLPPVLEIKMDEKSGTTTYDTSGQGNDGNFMNVASSPTWRGAGSCAIGNCLEFDGSNDYIDCDNAHSSFPGAFTVTAWVKHSGDNGNHPLLYLGGNDTPGLYIEDGSNNVHLYMGGSNRRVFNQGSLHNGNWHHVVFQIPGSAQSDITNSKAYVDGAELNASLTVSSGPQSSRLGCGIGGSDITGSSHDYKGFIDNVIIYDYVRTPAQIAWDYNRGKPIAHWKFDECSGETINDWSGNANHGSLVIGGSGTQTATGTCASSSPTEFWPNGASGKYNAAGSFDGTDDYIQTTSDDLKTVDNFTISAWINTDILPTDDNDPHHIVWQGDSAGNGGGQEGELALELGQSNFGVTDTVHLFIEGDGGADTDISAFAPFTDKINWRHIVAVAKGLNSAGSQEAELYVDGVLVATDTALGSADRASYNTNLRIGTTGTGERSFEGLIDDVKIFNYALTAEQIKTEYSGGAVRFGP